MDAFFQKLREIQKKERNIGGLAEVGENFYKDLYNYLDGLIIKIGNNPFSFDSYILRDAQRIAAEICERREHKITNSAVMNVQRSYGLFDKKSNFNPPGVIPLNMTPEEEKLYFTLMESLVEYRKKIISPLESSIKQKNPESQIKVSKKRETKNETSKSSIKGQEVERSTARKEIELGIMHDLESHGILEQTEPMNIKKNNETSNDKASNTKSQKNAIRTLMILEGLPSIIGVDRNVYGPISPQDVITMPEANALIIIKSNKGRSINI